MRTPDASMRTSATRVHQPLQVFQRCRLQSLEGQLHQGRASSVLCNPKIPQSIKIFQDPPLPCPKHVGATAVAHL
jgi:hypothetical protein